MPVVEPISDQHFLSRVGRVWASVHSVEWAAFDATRYLLKGENGLRHIIQACVDSSKGPPSGDPEERWFVVNETGMLHSDGPERPIRFIHGVPEHCLASLRRFPGSVLVHIKEQPSRT